MTPLELLNANPLPFAQHLGIEYLTAEPSRVTARLTVRPEFCTLNGVVHGGTLMAFADTLGGTAAFLNLPAGAKGTATIESKTNFLGAAPAGTVLTGECERVHAGRRTSVWQTRISAADGKLVALTIQTQMVL